MRVEGPNHNLSNTKAYVVWRHMLARCRRKTHPDYPRYGGRGITVCERWGKFVNFYADMGDRPDGLSLDRIDNDGGYEPGNCRWATRKEQQNNTRRNRILEYRGQRKNVTAWAHELGLNPTTVFVRLWEGKSIEQALAPTLR